MPLACISSSTSKDAAQRLQAPATLSFTMSKASLSSWSEPLESLPIQPVPPPLKIRVTSSPASLNSFTVVRALANRASSARVSMPARTKTATFAIYVSLPVLACRHLVEAPRGFGVDASTLRVPELRSKPPDKETAKGEAPNTNPRTRRVLSAQDAQSSQRAFSPPTASTIVLLESREKRRCSRR